MGGTRSYWMLVVSGVLAALGVYQLIAIAAAPEPIWGALAAFAGLVPGGYFLGLFAAQAKRVEAKPEELPEVPEGQSVVVPFRRRAR